MSKPMVRKATIALLLLGLALIGFQPVNMPAASTPAMAMDAQQPCCADCDHPAIPADGGCGAMLGCAAATPWVALPGLSLVPVSYATRLTLLPPDQSPPRAADVSPPFRPPRLSILA
jgi:hypothetical protein